MILIAISFSLLALVAGMYLLDKTKKEGLGKFYSFISWLVIVISMLVLLSSLTWEVCRMSCRPYMEGSMEMCGPGMMGGDDCCMYKGGRGCMMDEERCGEMMGKGKMKDKCCEMEEEDDDGNEKEIQEEILIEKDTVKK